MILLIRSQLDEPEEKHYLNKYTTNFMFLYGNSYLGCLGYLFIFHSSDGTISSQIVSLPRFSAPAPHKNP